MARRYGVFLSRLSNWRFISFPGKSAPLSSLSPTAIPFAYPRGTSGCLLLLFYLRPGSGRLSATTVMTVIVTAGVTASDNGVIVIDSEIRATPCKAKGCSREHTCRPVRTLFVPRTRVCHSQLGSSMIAKLSPSSLEWLAECLSVGET